NLNGLNAALANQAMAQFLRGDFQKALQLVQESEKLSKQLGSHGDLASGLTMHGLIFDRQGEHVEAELLHREAEKLARQLNDQVVLQGVLGQLAYSLMEQGRLKESLETFTEQEQICRHLGKTEHLAKGLVGKARLLHEKMGLSRDAIPPAEEAYQLARTCDLEKLAKGIADLLGGIRASISRDGFSLYENGRLEDAAASFAEDLRVARLIGNRQMIAGSLGALASMYQEMGNLEKALPCFKEKEQICRELNDNKG